MKKIKLKENVVHFSSNLFVELSKNFQSKRPPIKLMVTENM